MDRSSSQPPLSILIVSALIAVVLQLAVAPTITLFGVVPNFILVAVTITATRNSSVRSTITGFILGLLFDFCSLGPIGAMALVLTILAYAVSSSNKGAFSGSIITDMIIMVVAIALGNLLISVIYAVVGVNPEFLLSLAQRVLPAIVYDALIGGLFLLLYNTVTGTGNRPTRSSASRGTGRSLSRKLHK